MMELTIEYRTDHCIMHEGKKKQGKQGKHSKRRGNKSIVICEVMLKQIE